MASTPLIPQLRPLLGVENLEAVPYSSIEALVGQKENEYLDVKDRVYDNASKLAESVVAFANSAGGVLVFGAKDKDDTITELTPVDLAGQELPLLSRIADATSPPVRVQTHSVPCPDDDTRGLLLVHVPPSERAPHAAHAKGGGFVYKVRNRRENRTLTESEVYDRYLARARRADEDSSRLKEIHSSILKYLDASPDDPQWRHAWIVLAALPARRLHVPISRQGLADAKGWASNVIEALPDPAQFSGLADFAATGFRSYVLGDYGLHERRRAAYRVAELHSDGGVAFAVAVGSPREDYPTLRSLHEDTEIVIQDEALTFASIGVVQAAGSWLARQGAYGPVDTLASLQTPGATQVAQDRGFPQGAIGVWAPAEFAEVARTVVASDVAAASEALVATTNLIAGDLVAQFGEPESSQIDPNGRLDWRFVSRQNKPMIEHWARKHGIAIHDHPTLAPAEE